MVKKALLAFLGTRPKRLATTKSEVNRSTASDGSAALKALEAKLGYPFKDLALLKQALTHTSAGLHRRSNQSLEFLGDALLDFLIAEQLFSLYPQATEGQLTRMRAHLVNRETLGQLGRQLGIDQLLKVGKTEAHDPTALYKLMGDSLEAIIGAIYLDGGFEAAKNALSKVYALHFPKLDEPSLTALDAKSQLQEYCQAHFKKLPQYHLIEIKGAPPIQSFKTRCCLETASQYLQATGTGRNKKLSEQDAAKKLFQAFKGQPTQSETLK